MTRLLGTVMLVAVCSGCVLIPLPQTSKYKDIDAAAVAFISVGATTREEVVLHLGAPDQVGDDGAYHYYLDSRPWLFVLFVPIPGPGFGSSVGDARGVPSRTGSLVVEFGPNSIVTGCWLDGLACRRPRSTGSQ